MIKNINDVCVRKEINLVLRNYFLQHQLGLKSAASSAPAPAWAGAAGTTSLSKSGAACRNFLFQLSPVFCM